MSGTLSRQVFNLDYVCPILGTKLHLYETIILHKMTYWFGDESTCGNFIVGMCPSLPKLALICQLPLSTLKKYLAKLLKRQLLGTNNKKTSTGNNIYHANLLIIKPFLMTEEQQVEFLANQKKQKMESEERRLGKKKESQKTVQDSTYSQSYDGSETFRGHTVAPENMQKENFQGPQEKLLGATGETFRGHTVAPTNDLLINEINKLNTESNPEIITEEEFNYLFNSNNNVWEEEDAVIEESTSVSCSTEEANKNVEPVVEKAHKIEFANPDEKGIHDTLIEVKKMRSSGEIHPSIVTQDEELAEQGWVHIASQMGKKDQHGVNYSYRQALGSFKALVKKGTFARPYMMDKFNAIREERENKKQNWVKQKTDQVLGLVNGQVRAITSTQIHIVTKNNFMKIAGSLEAKHWEEIDKRSYDLICKDGIDCIKEAISLSNNNDEIARIAIQRLNLNKVCFEEVKIVLDKYGLLPMDSCQTYQEEKQDSYEPVESKEKESIQETAVQVAPEYNAQNNHANEDTDNIPSGLNIGSFKAIDQLRDNALCDMDYNHEKKQKQRGNAVSFFELIQGFPGMQNIKTFK